MSTLKKQSDVFCSRFLCKIIIINGLIRTWSVCVCVCVLHIGEPKWRRHPILKWSHGKCIIIYPTFLSSLLKILVQKPLNFRKLYYLNISHIPEHFLQNDLLLLTVSVVCDYIFSLCNMRFSQWCGGRFKLSGMWCCVSGWMTQCHS